MAITRSYASRYPRQLPDLDTCTEADMIDLAAHMLSAPSDLPAAYVERLSKAIESLSLQLEVAHGLGQSMRSLLLKERDAHQATTLMLEAEVTDAARFRIKLAEAQGEAAAAEHLNLKLRSAVLAVTGRTAEEIQAEHELWSRLEQADVRRRMDLETTEVVDLECLDEPAACRTMTPRVAFERMAEVIGGAP